MAEAVPNKSEAVRVDFEDAKATSQHRPQSGRRREQLRRPLSLRSRQDEQERGYCGVLNHDRLPPPCFRFRQEDGNAAADGINLPARVVHIRCRDPRDLANAQPTIVRYHHSHASRHVAG